MKSEIRQITDDPVKFSRYLDSLAQRPKSYHDEVYFFQDSTKYESNYLNTVRGYVDNLKATTSCTDCKQKFPAYVMDFDHLPNFDKIKNVSSLIRSHMEVVIAEIKKCEIVCSNCHRIRTYKRRMEQKR
jgi:hypothetical protein